MPTAAMAATLSKMEIIGLLARQHGFTRYLELCTPTTGCRYARLDRQILTAPCRLMYNCPADFEDGLGIDFRSETFDYSPCLAEIHRRNLRYDIILIELFHEYDFSYRDLTIAFDLLEAGGIIVAHDCLPPTAAMATPHFIPGCWCGVSYKAYLDFVQARGLDYCTVDTDYGCGIISKPDRLSHLAKRLQTYASAIFDLYAAARLRAATQSSAVARMERQSDATSIVPSACWRCTRMSFSIWSAPRNFSRALARSMAYNLK